MKIEINHSKKDHIWKSTEWVFAWCVSIETSLRFFSTELRHLFWHTNFESPKVYKHFCALSSLSSTHLMIKRKTNSQNQQLNYSLCVVCALAPRRRRWRKREREFLIPLIINVLWLMAVFQHDKRRQIVSQNNFADITTKFTTEITLFPVWKRSHSASQPTKQPTDISHRQQPASTCKTTHKHTHTHTRRRSLSVVRCRCRKGAHFAVWYRLASI